MTLPASLKLFVQSLQQTPHVSYAQFNSQLSTLNRRKYSLLFLIFISPLIYKQLKKLYLSTNFHKERRKRHESFYNHLQQSLVNEVKERNFKQKFIYILKIIIPSVYSTESFLIVLHTFFLILRTYLSVVVARIDGRIVKNMVSANLSEFIKGLGMWFLIAVPATFTNSIIRYLQSKLALNFRTNLVNYINLKYLNEDLLYYKLDDDTDQLICNDVSKFADTLSSLYSNLAKPILDTIVFNYQLYTSIGTSGMTALFVNYIFTAYLLRKVTPGFGQLAAVEAKLEGDFRQAHSRVITNAEEIAFYHGGNRELGILDTVYNTLIRHVNRIFRIRIGYNMFEDFIVKYSWSAIGLLVCSVPVFFSSSSEAGEDLENSQQVSGITPQPQAETKESTRTQGFITNKRLMMSLADAGGRMMYSYKEINQLQGYTSRVYELLMRMEEIKCKNVEHVIKDDKFMVKDVDIFTPNGDLLIKKLNIEVEDYNLLITGANGCGKTSIMRVASELWEHSGEVRVPESIIYIPQRAYLSIGTLRDQVIYPDTREDMARKGVNEDQLMEILEIVHLDYLPEREGGWDTVKEWKDVFSGGEKQRMNLARLFYHKPQYAMLDECTSAVSNDVEGRMYSKAKDFCTLITISHRPSLIKHHEKVLRIENKTFDLVDMTSDLKSVEEEIREIERALREEERLKRRLREINKELGVKVDAVKK